LPYWRFWKIAFILHGATPIGEIEACIMASKAKTSSGKRQAPGPKPDNLKLNGNWGRAVKKSLRKKKPSKGWPK
jgi:hypothetical protein